MAYRIDINCDMGESYGKFVKGRDEEVMPYITTANIAAGFHAGDPHVMRKTVLLAKQYGVNVGVHPGLPDVLGFGRRKMDATPEEVRDYVVYQLGALRAFTDQFDVTFQHVKPHGAMYSMLSESEEHARAVIEAILEIDDSLIYLATDQTIYQIAKEYPIRVVLEGYVDLDYRPEGTIIIPREKQARDPTLVADRFVSIATKGQVEAINGDILKIPAQSICIHGDGPNVVELLQEIHSRLEHANIELMSLTDMV
ncbi:MAG TPA: LamB/YcsF family protein [Chloroflexi bacterium]|nr:LamB/YcsF family protein [Chloroflexota bacterium]